MTRNFWLLLSSALVLLGLMVWISQQSTFLYKHPTSKDVRITVTRDEGAVIDAVFRNPKAFADDPEARKLPRVFLPEKEYDFGVMNPLTVGRHSFVIRNEGTADLLLEVASTSCKCTVGGLEKNRVAPGEATKIELEWNTGKYLHFSHGATIRSNDPIKREFELVVFGKVKTLLATDVALVNANDLVAGQPKEVEFVVHSQTFNDFEVTKVSNPLADFPWTTEKVVDPAVLKELDAASAVRVRVTVDAELVKNPQFEGRFTITGKPLGELRIELAERPEQEEVQVAFRGNTASRYALFGGKIVGNHVEMGSSPKGAVKESRLLLKIRDREQTLENLKVTCEPNFLTAEVTPREDAPGVFAVILRVPPTAPACQYLGSPKYAQVRIESSHPRIPLIEIPVSFSIFAR